MHAHFSVSSGVAVVELLVVGGVLAFVAERRNWRPPLWVALSVGLALRLQMLLLTYMTRPYDILHDYYAAGVSVLHHVDPILHARPTGWTFLPLYAFIIAGEILLQNGLHIPWTYAVASFAFVADLAVIYLVGRVAGERQGALRRFQYACYPLAAIVSAGRMDVTCLALSLAAFALLLHRTAPVTARRALGAGAVLGLAVGVNSWPILFLPGLWRALPSLRTRLYATLGVGAVMSTLFATMPLTVGTPLGALPRDARTILTYHATIGGWGWTAVIVTAMHLQLYTPLAQTIGSIASLLTLAAIIAALWWWRRAHPVDLASVAPCTLLVVTGSFGMQYLMWPVPMLLARPPKRAWWYHVGVNIWAILELSDQAVPSYPRHVMNASLSVASLVVIPAIVVAMPWQRRIRRRALPEERRAPGSRPLPDLLDRMVLRDHIQLAPAINQDVGIED